MSEPQYQICVVTVSHVCESLSVSFNDCCLLMLTVAEFAESLLKLSDIMSDWMPDPVRYFQVRL